MEIASLRVGYGDGFRRIKNHFVSVNGVRCPVLGNVCMDVCVIDVTGLDCKVGQRAYILGKMSILTVFVSRIVLYHTKY